jgi:hypothetical protein
MDKALQNNPPPSHHVVGELLASPNLKVFKKPLNIQREFQYLKEFLEGHPLEIQLEIIQSFRGVYVAHLNNLIILQSEIEQGIREVSNGTP